MESLLVPQSSPVTSVQVHPVVIYQICDSFIRRNEGQERVIGTLLGNIEGGVAVVKNCFTVIHSEQDGEVRGSKYPPSLESNQTTSLRASSLSLLLIPTPLSSSHTTYTSIYTF